MRYSNLYRVEEILSMYCETSTHALIRAEDGKQYPARPLGIPSPFHRLKLMWMVWRGEVDCIKWYDSGKAKRIKKPTNKLTMNIKLEALHFLAGKGFKCSECTMADMPCPLCYEKWFYSFHKRPIKPTISKKDRLKNIANEIAILSEMPYVATDIEERLRKGQRLPFKLSDI